MAAPPKICREHRLLVDFPRAFDGAREVDVLA
jgi:hypothetical protein